VFQILFEVTRGFEIPAHMVIEVGGEVVVVLYPKLPLSIPSLMRIYYSQGGLEHSSSSKISVDAQKEGEHYGQIYRVP
jgi:hypothetical protein